MFFFPFTAALIQQEYAVVTLWREKTAEVIFDYSAKFLYCWKASGGRVATGNKHFSFPIAGDFTKSITGQSERNDTLKEDICFLRARRSHKNKITLSTQMPICTIIF